MKPAMHWSFVCQFLQIKLFLASLRGLRLLCDLQQQKDTHSARKSLGMPAKVVNLRHTFVV